MDHEPGAQADAAPHQSMLAGLLARLFRDAETLLLQELALVRAETGESIGRLIGGALIALAGTAIALAGILAVIGTVIILLSQVIPLWVASLIVGLALCGTGMGLVLHGRRVMAKASLVPRRALASWRETEAWAREELT